MTDQPDSEEELHYEPSREERARRRSKKKIFSPEKLSETALSETALNYLNRYDSTVEQMRRLLRKRLLRYGDDTIAPEVEKRIETLIQRLQESNLLSAPRFASVAVRSQLSQGHSQKKVHYRLEQKGLGEDEIENALSLAADQEGLDDLSAAKEFVRKRNLLRRYDLRQSHERKRAFAHLARQGFSIASAEDALGCSYFFDEGED
ncbi:MAG: RecX family transcriptional regulator [Polyangiaceae bacterium]|nr:RecX family transcriptional regulator [Polyangiaceae bacterium]